jgi:MarR family transcriptional regulator, lower aerobic nicotinate degradation pathway regulator
MVNTASVPATAPTSCVPRELLESPLFLLGRLGYEVKTEVMDAFEAAGFSAYCYSVLAVLEEGARETQATIADGLKIDRGQLVGVLDELEEHEFIERKRDPNDRRRHLVSLTRAGRRQLTAYRRLAQTLEDQVFAALDDDERAQLCALLQRVAGARDARYAPRG